MADPYHGAYIPNGGGPPPQYLAPPAQPPFGSLQQPFGQNEQVHSSHFHQGGYQSVSYQPMPPMYPQTPHAVSPYQHHGYHNPEHAQGSQPLSSPQQQPYQIPAMPYNPQPQMPHQMHFSAMNGPTNPPSFRPSFPRGPQQGPGNDRSAVNRHRGSAWRPAWGSGPRPSYRGRGMAPARQEVGYSAGLGCEPCQKSFSNSQQLAAHLATHLKCDFEGCSFSSSGKMLKEHKLTAHGARDASSLSIKALRAMELRPKESPDEIQRWIEERKRNYPTEVNLKKKSDEAAARLARGELQDEDSVKRSQRLREIVKLQAKLGLPVAEIPPHYLSGRPGGGRGSRGRGLGPSRGGYGRGQGRQSRVGEQTSEQKEDVSMAAVDQAADGGLPEIVPGDPEDGSLATAGTPAVGGKRGREVTLGEAERNANVTKVLCLDGAGKSLVPNYELSDDECASKDEVNGMDVGVKREQQRCHFFMKGRCRKGTRCNFSHSLHASEESNAVEGNGAGEGEGADEGGNGSKIVELGGSGKNKNKRGAVAAPREPTLLAKLLEKEVRKDKSCLLQALRFFVNNNYLLTYPYKPLKFFKWSDVENNETEDGETTVVPIE